MPNPFEIDNKPYDRVKFGKNLSFDEAFLDAHEDAEVLDNERDHINYRALGGIVLLVVMILGFRVFFLQGVKGDEYRSLAEGNKLRVQYVLAPRGLLQDRYGKVIASNTPSFELDVITGDLPTDPNELNVKLAAVAEITGQDPASLKEAISKMVPSAYQAQSLVENISKDQALILIARAPEFKGFVVENNAIRDYKDALAFSHLAGYTGKITAAELEKYPDDNYALNDYIGKTGLEAQYEDFLRGINGRKQTEIDAQGNFKRTLAEVPAINGNNVKLNIDYDLQKVLYDSLVKMTTKFRAPKAAAVVTNPQTGEVLALISMPSFDNNMFARGIKQGEYAPLINDPNSPLLNRVVAGTYPPGSTVKPMMAIAALSEGIVTPETKILDDGVIRVGSFTYYGYERAGLGIVDVYSAIARSSDIYFYTVGGGNPKTSVKEGLGPERIAQYLRKFKMGEKLGIDLPGEKPGLVPDTAWKKAVKNEPWYLGNTYHYVIGQGDLLVTPLQVNSWTATIGNGGKVMQPYILDQVEDKNGKVLAEGQSKVLAENIFDPKYIKVAQDGMRQTVLMGSGSTLQNVGVEVSGKTGTAQFDARDLSLTHAWWTSYAPSVNPQIALTVLVESSGEGHAVAVPVAKDVYTWWAANRYQK